MQDYSQVYASGFIDTKFSAAAKELHIEKRPLMYFLQ